LNALEPVTGKLLWQRQVCSDAGSTMVEWGMSGSPLLHKSMVIVDAGGDAGRALVAYDQGTGEPVWSIGRHKAGYTAPRIEVINGKTQLLVFHGDGLEAHDPDTGKSLWYYPWTNQYKINVAQPIRFNDTVFLSSGYDSGCVLLDPTRLTGGRPAEVWPPSRSLKLKFNEAVSLGNHVYGLDDGILACIDATSGERCWKGGRYRFGHVLLWQNMLLIQAEDGAVALVEATPEAFREITRFQPLNDRTWNVPAVAHGRLYVRNAAEMACFSLPPAATVSPSLSEDENTASIRSPQSVGSSVAPAASSGSSASLGPRTDGVSQEPSRQP
jgi:outer membrane protein assembly factor BamB